MHRLALEAIERSDLDVRSLVLQQPDFTFLKSREFFLSETASCDRPMHDVKLLKARAESSFLALAWGQATSLRRVIGL